MMGRSRRHRASPSVRGWGGTSWPHERRVTLRRNQRRPGAADITWPLVEEGQRCLDTGADNRHIRGDELIVVAVLERLQADQAKGGGEHDQTGERGPKGRRPTGNARPPGPGGEPECDATQPERREDRLTHARQRDREACPQRRSAPSAAKERRGVPRNEPGHADRGAAAKECDTVASRSSMACGSDHARGAKARPHTSAAATSATRRQAGVVQRATRSGTPVPRRRAPRAPGPGGLRSRSRGSLPPPRKIIAGLARAVLWTPDAVDRFGRQSRFGGRAGSPRSRKYRTRKTRSPCADGISPAAVATTRRMGSGPRASSPPGTPRELEFPA